CILKVDGGPMFEAEVVKDHDSLAGLARGETLYFKPKAFQPVANL
ncbi:sulfate ABC transporter ATP-binding protein, partial [Pseudomonas aeruginosa]